VAGVRLILKYQWKAHWRRFMRAGQVTQLDMLLLLLFGALFIYKLPPDVWRASRELTIGQTASMERLFFPLAIAWFYSLFENSLISLSPKNLFRYPLTTSSLLLIRIGSFFISPVAMIITASSLLGALPLLAAPRPFFGIVAALLFFVTVASLGLSLSHFMSSAVLRRSLMIAALVAIAALGVVLFTVGRDAARRLGVTVLFTPIRLVTRAAVAPDYWTALTSLSILIACVALALLLLRWSFGRSLSDQEVNRPRANRAARFFRFPGRLGGLVRKEQKYFRKMPAPWICLLFTLAYSQIFWLAAPYPATYHSIILLVFFMNNGLSWNSFGLDEPLEINRYLLFPLRGRDILLGKNLGFVVIVAVQLSVMLPFALWRLGWRDVSFGLIEAAALFFSYLAWGNLASVIAPFKMRFYRMESGGSLITAMMGLALCSLPFVAIVLLTRLNSELLAAKIASILALTALAYLGSLHFAGRKFERNWQKISRRLT
jgi:hypothetical protein